MKQNSPMTNTMVMISGDRLLPASMATTDAAISTPPAMPKRLVVPLSIFLPYGRVASAKASDQCGVGKSHKSEPVLRADATFLL
jgi:hypothetical protein